MQKSSDINKHNISLINKLREKVQQYLTVNANESALFWADKVATLSNDDPRDVYWLSKCMFHTHQYHRAALLLINKKLDQMQPLCQWLAGLALYEAQKYEDALSTLTFNVEQLGTIDVQVQTNDNSPSCNSFCSDYFLEGFTVSGFQSAMLLLRGNVYEALNNHDQALACFKKALKYDIFNFEALNNLLQHQKLSAEEEKVLLASLPFTGQCEDQNLLPRLYELLINKYQIVPSYSTLSADIGLSENIDLQVAEAERLYYSCNYRKCFTITEEILKKDSYHSTCLPVHISCSFELKKVNHLFYLAHNLVDLLPHKAISWFAVGCYYLLIRKNDLARKYLAKAASLDKQFGPAWLAYGHSFASENEHDQAMAAYFSASKIMKGSHLPFLYLGIECSLTNNVILAEKFLSHAQNIAPEDPFVIHEMGVTAFRNHDYLTAEKHFLKVLVLVQNTKQSEVLVAEKWEPLFNNLGHTCRKLKKYDVALSYHQKALMFRPQDPSTIACIGLIMSLKGDLSEAIVMFHKVLGLQPDDSFSMTMLSFVTEHSMEIASPF